jgi:hypothetical protein
MTNINPTYIVAIIALVGIVVYLVTNKSGSSGNSLSDGGVSVDPLDPANWQFGPVINGLTESPNMGTIRKTANGFEFDVPTQDGLHYLTKSSSALTGKTGVIYEGNIKLSPGAKLVPTTEPNGPSMMTPYFQRKGDNWTAQGEYEAYRWYASFATMTPIAAGPFSFNVRFDQNWTAILTSSKATNPTGFQGAIDNTGRDGLVFGGGTGLGHGVYVVGGTATIEITRAEVY